MTTRTKVITLVLLMIVFSGLTGCGGGGSAGVSGSSGIKIPLGTFEFGAENHPEGAGAPTKFYAYQNGRVGGSISALELEKSLGEKPTTVTIHELKSQSDPFVEVTSITLTRTDTGWSGTFEGDQLSLSKLVVGQTTLFTASMPGSVSYPQTYPDPSDPKNISMVDAATTGIVFTLKGAPHYDTNPQVGGSIQALSRALGEVIASY